MASILRMIELVAAIGAALYVLLSIVAAWKRVRSNQKWLPILLLCCVPSISEAACDTTTVQNQINAASNGDTVTITPADCTATWNTVVTKSSSKYITLDFNGATITCGTPCTSNNSPILRVTTTSAGPDRVTGFNFISSNGSDALEVFMEVVTAANDERFRIDHCSFDGDAIGFHLQVSGPGYGLIDHCTFLWEGNNEVIQHEGYGSGSHTGWTVDVTPGSLDALYVEDSTFTNRITGAFQGGKTLSAYGAKTVYRFNVLNCMQLDVHGTAGSVGGRYWEHYHNTHNAQPNCNNVDKWHQIRAGTGMIFNNTFGAGTNNGNGAIILWEEDSGTYPLLFQVGRGKCSANPCTSGGSSNMALDPAYIWGNENPPLNVGVDEVTGSTIVRDRDYYEDANGGVGVGAIGSRSSTCTTGQAYWATDEGEWWAANAGADGRLYKCTATNTWTLYYTPATYPHTLQGAGGGGGSGGLLFLEWATLLASLSWHFRLRLLAGMMAAAAVGASTQRVLAEKSYQASVILAKKYLESRK